MYGALALLYLMYLWPSIHNRTNYLLLLFYVVLFENNLIFYLMTKENQQIWYVVDLNGQFKVEIQDKSGLDFFYL